MALPHGWRTAAVDELKAPGAYTCVGGPFGSSLTTQDYVEDGVPVIRGTNMTGENGHISTRGFVYVSPEKADSLERNLAYPGDIVFTQRGTLGQVAMVPEDSDVPRYVLSQSQMKLTPNRTLVCDRYLLHYFRSPAALVEIENRTLATGVPHINLGILKALRVPLPPLPEQRRIADILDKADAIRRKRKEAIALTEDLLRSAFLEMFGDPVTNPKEWDQKPLGEVADIVGGGTPSRTRPEFYEGTVPWATAKDFRSEIMVTTQEHVSDHAIRASATKLVPSGTILVVVKSKILMRRLPVAVAAVPLCFNQDVKGILARNAAVSTYLASHLRMAEHQLLKLARGANTEGLTSQHLKTFAVMQPPECLIQRFSRLESALRRSIERGADALRHSEELFDSIAQRAFRGELGFSQPGGELAARAAGVETR